MFEQKLQEIFDDVSRAVDNYQVSLSGTFEQRSKAGGELQWLLIVRMLSELCQHGTEKEVREITNALHDVLVKVVFRS